MKKILVTFLILLFSLSLFSCSSNYKQETLDGLSYDYPANALREEDPIEEGFYWYFLDCDDKAENKGIIQIEWNEFDSILYDTAGEEYFRNCDFIEENWPDAEKGDVVIDGNNATSYSEEDYQSIILNHGDYVLWINAYGLDKKNSKQELDNLIQSMKFD